MHSASGAGSLRAAATSSGSTRQHRFCSRPPRRFRSSRPCRSRSTRSRHTTCSRTIRSLCSHQDTHTRQHCSQRHCSCSRPPRRFGSSRPCRSRSRRSHRTTCSRTIRSLYSRRDMRRRRRRLRSTRRSIPDQEQPGRQPQHQESENETCLFLPLRVERSGAGADSPRSLIQRAWLPRKGRSIPGRRQQRLFRTRRQQIAVGHDLSDMCRF
jgi:hypothetical protein